MFVAVVVGMVMAVVVAAVVVRMIARLGIVMVVVIVFVFVMVMVIVVVCVGMGDGGGRLAGEFPYRDGPNGYQHQQGDAASQDIGVETGIKDQPQHVPVRPLGTDVSRTAMAPQCPAQGDGEDLVKEVILGVFVTVRMCHDSLFLPLMGAAARRAGP